MVVNHNIETRDKMLNCRIYSINYENCSSQHIGKAYRKFNIIFNGYLAKYGLNKPHASNVAKHCIENNHSCSQSQFNILHAETKFRKLQTLEVLEIFLNLNLIRDNLTSMLLASRDSMNTDIFVHG